MRLLLAVIELVNKALIEPLIAAVRALYDVIFVPSANTDVPDLDELTAAPIVADNVRAIQPIYLAWMMDELGLFAVVDKLVQLFQEGRLPIGRGSASDRLYAYWKQAATRMTEAERRNVYAQAFGLPGGEGGETVNREFNDLWMRFVSAVTSLAEQESDEAYQAQVKSAGRDLAANLSTRGAIMAVHAAPELHRETAEAMALVSDNEIRSAFGARSMWEVIDQVATLELGGARNRARYRTLATAGAVVTAWLANHVQELLPLTPEPILDIDNPGTGDPSDKDLVDACEQWLAAKVGNATDT